VNILQVLTYVSPTGDFGGPVRVAANQATELRRRGHEVRLLAGAKGYDRLPDHWEGTPATVCAIHRVLPGAGASGVASPMLLARARRPLEWADVVHVNFGRDLVTMPIAAIARAMRKPLVLQTHGMIDASSRLLARPLDVVLTRPLLSSADAVLFLTDAERQDLEQVFGGPLDRASRLPNGIAAPIAVDGVRDPKLVLFAARLHEQKRPEVFVDLAVEVLRAIPDARFVMIGPDGGSAPSVRRRISERRLGDRISCLGPMEHGLLLEWFARAAVYVLPSIYEPFGMTALEAMSVGTPVVVSDTCGLAPDVRRTGAGIVTRPDPDSLGRAVVDLLRDPERRVAAGAAGVRVAAEEFSIGAVVDRLESVYLSVTPSKTETPAAGVIQSAETTVD
jgi:glycosyltransferase involved in cell wall biosynthesis